MHIIYLVFYLFRHLHCIPMMASFPRGRESSIIHYHVMSCHVVQSLPTDLVRSKQTLLYHVVLVGLLRPVPAAVSMFRYKSGRRPALEPVLWFVACVGCLLVRCGAQEDSSSGGGGSSSLRYQELCR